MIYTTDSEALTNIAFHEAGHAVVALIYGIIVKHVSISDEGDKQGVVLYAARETYRANRCSTKTMSCNFIGAALAGALIEKAAGDIRHVAIEDMMSAADWKIITDCMARDGISQKEFDVIMAETKSILSRRSVRLAIADVARALLERTELDGGQVRAIVRRHLSLL